MRYSLTALTLLTLSTLVAIPAIAQEESYELPTYTDAERWERSATLLNAVLVGDLAKQMSEGMTATQVGEASAAVFGPPNGWNNANTPMRLFRGMYRNWMSDPAQECELLEAGENIVRARCNRPYLAYFGDDGEAWGVTVQDFEDSGRAFSSTIADKHGMDWEEHNEGEYTVFTVRKR